MESLEVRSSKHGGKDHVLARESTWLDRRVGIGVTCDESEKVGRMQFMLGLAS